IKTDLLPEQLKVLLSPIDNKDHEVMIEITKRCGTPSQEYCHMLMATVPENEINKLTIMDSVSDGVVSYSVPDCDNKGELENISYTLNGYDYLVACWGDSNFYTYNLSEKVWMTLGLSQRCVGNSDQKVVYDDLSHPVTCVAEGEISNVFFYQQNRDVVWKMRSDYLRQYLWMRGQVAVRSFYYEKSIDDTTEIRSIMNGKSHYNNAPENGWYSLDIMELDADRLLLKVWATVAAVYPEKCTEKNINELVWPGDNSAMGKSRVESIISDPIYPTIYLKDDFLKKYEGDSIYRTVPVIDPDNRVFCNPEYQGRWSFVGLQRLGRNILKVSAYDLYTKAVPDHEILHAHEYAISPDHAKSFDRTEEDIIRKTDRLIKSLLKLADLLCSLAFQVGVQENSAEDYIGLSAEKIQKNGWVDYPIISKLAGNAPIQISEEGFLSKCKTLVECLNKIKTGPLKTLLVLSGIDPRDLKQFRNFKLLGCIKNILDYLLEEQEDPASWIEAASLCEWQEQNESLSALFIANDLRQADAHEKIGGCIIALEKLGFDSAKLNSGYGYALDFVYDKVIDSLDSINNALTIFLKQKN
ncbi:MAG: hypothetical protein NTU49_00105, partial [Gammaproteobacteria bacterium]|nr:hypothetical protein [Gammaproteobacteria bacterium]